jgi:hypothetical protein
MHFFSHKATFRSSAVSPLSPLHLINIGSSPEFVKDKDVQDSSCSIDASKARHLQMRNVPAADGAFDASGRRNGENAFEMAEIRNKNGCLD